MGVLGEPSSPNPGSPLPFGLQRGERLPRTTLTLPMREERLHCLSAFSAVSAKLPTTGMKAKVKRLHCLSAFSAVSANNSCGIRA